MKKIYTSITKEFLIATILFFINTATFAQTPLLLKDINSSGGSTYEGTALTVLNGVAYFAADDGVHGIELWASKGKATNTVLVKDITAGINSTNVYSMCGAAGKCFFTNNDPNNAQLVVYFDTSAQHVVLNQNVFHGTKSRHAISFGMEKGVAGDDQLLLAQNTLLSKPDGVALLALYGGIGRDVTIRDNLLSASTGGFCFAAEANPFAAKAREEWIVRNNWGGRRETLPDWVPLTDPAHTGELPYLSLDPEHPNFLRLDPAKLPSGVTNIPGALPPGPPPPAGDWFTRLQSRLKEAQAASQAQFK